jgi:hypothetical protein
MKLALYECVGVSRAHEMGQIFGALAQTNGSAFVTMIYAEGLHTLIIDRGCNILGVTCSDS